MKYLQISMGKEAFVDDEDYERCLAYTWGYVKTKGREYARNSNNLYLHHFITGDAEETDHKDGNGLNNQKSNLRKCTHSQNLWNQPTKPGGYREVYWDKSRQKWLASIQNGGKTIFIGRFKTAEIAARAYDREAFRTRGEFAVLNFPGEL